MAGTPGPVVEKRRADGAALFIAAAMLVLAAVLVWDASRLGGAATYARIGPQIAPQVIALCLAGLGLWTAIEAFRGDFPARERQEFRPVLWIVAGLVGQLVLLRITGFSIATGVLFGAVAYGLGRRPLWIGIPVGIVLALIVWIVFARGLSLNLPAGPLEAFGSSVVGTIIEMGRIIVGAVANFIASFR